MEGHTAHSDQCRSSITFGELRSLPVQEWPERWQALQRRIDEEFEPYKDLSQRMTPWQRKAWRHMKLPEIKRRLDAQPMAVAGDDRRPRAEARPREQGRGRSRVTRAGPSGDDDPDPEPPASPFQAAWRSALHLTASELDVLVSHARIRISLLRRWAV
jgi:hypothetical protein